MIDYNDTINALKDFLYEGVSLKTDCGTSDKVIENTLKQLLSNIRDSVLNINQSANRIPTPTMALESGKQLRKALEELLNQSEVINNPLVLNPIKETLTYINDCNAMLEDTEFQEGYTPMEETPEEVVIEVDFNPSELL